MLFPALILALAASTFVSARPSFSAPAPAPRDPGPSLSEFLGSLAIPAGEEKRQTPSDATVKMCTGTHFTGQCYNATWLTDECIDLKGYAGQVRSFQPVSDADCFLTQKQCDSSVPFVELDDSASQAQIASDLTIYKWINNIASYICFADKAAAERYVRLQRLRVGIKDSK